MEPGAAPRPPDESTDSPSDTGDTLPETMSLSETVPAERLAPQNVEGPPPSVQPREPEPPRRPLPPVPPREPNDGPPVRRPRVELFQSTPSFLRAPSQDRETCCPGCGVARDHRVVAWTGSHGIMNSVYNNLCDCHSTWTLSTIPPGCGSGTLLCCMMPWLTAERSAASGEHNAGVQPGCIYPRCTRCGNPFEPVQVNALSHMCTVGHWICGQCNFILYGTILFDHPWMHFSAAISRGTVRRVIQVD